MPGMGRSLQTGNSLIVSSFHSALFHQFLIVILVVVLCGVAFNVVRTVQYRRLRDNGSTAFPPRPATTLPVPTARRLLRLGFGSLWVLDGLLQMQSSMPLGLPSGVIQPSAASSPAWVQHLVNSGTTIWSNHPVEAAAATVCTLALASSAAAGAPAMPRRLDHSPSCMAPPQASDSSSQCWASTMPIGRA